MLHQRFAAVLAAMIAHEQHYDPKELAALWGLSPTKVRRMFVDEPGVLRIGEPSRRVGRTLKVGTTPFASRTASPSGSMRGLQRGGRLAVTVPFPRAGDHPHMRIVKLLDPGRVVCPHHGIDMAKHSRDLFGPLPRLELTYRKDMAQLLRVCL